MPFFATSKAVFFVVYAVMSLVSQLLMAVFWGVCYSVSMYNPYVRNVTKTALPYIVDLLSLSGSFCLLITRYEF